MASEKKPQTNKLEKLDSSLLTRSTMYTTLDAIDQGCLSTAGYVKAAGRKRLLGWYQDLSADYHTGKRRLDGKSNGGMVARVENTSFSLEQRGLDIGRKGFRVKRKRTETHVITRCYKAQRRIFNRFLADQASVNASNNSSAATMNAPEPAQQERQSVDDATRQFVQNLSTKWRTYYKTRKGKSEKNTCWIGAPVLHCTKQAILCGESKNTWRVYRLDTGKMLHVEKSEPLQVVIPNDEDNGSELQFCISIGTNSP